MMLKFLQIPVCKKPQSGKINQTSLNLLPGYDTLPNYIIGDPAYPLTPYCMKEYQTCVENKQDVFNNLLRNAEATLLKKRLSQAFCCEICKISRNTFFTEHLWRLLLEMQEIKSSVLLGGYRLMEGTSKNCTFKI